MSSLLHNRFKLIKKCGSGGTADVYKAEDTRLKRIVALKRVRGGTEPERKRKALRLLKEAEHLAGVDHPNVVAIHDSIETETSVTIVMEFVQGIPFRELFLKRPIPEHEFHACLRQLVLALEAVHETRILHRDVNPRNVLVTPAGVLKLIDFGLSTPVEQAKHRAGGSIGYMAPEALRKGSRLGFGVDIYALGFLSYQALIGGPEFQRLYGSSKPLEWARWMLSRERFRTLVELGIPVSGGLSAIVEKMLEKDVKDRYTRIADVRREIEGLEQASAAPAIAAAPTPPPGPSFAAGVRRLLPSLLAKPGEKKP
ncbi:MAG TPA: serine/threonine-protein kinase [Planctomycetota bacterium]|nr:serine/threonine-protein kinase [Planctomycetota bacterium]